VKDQYFCSRNEGAGFIYLYNLMRAYEQIYSSMKVWFWSVRGDHNVLLQYFYKGSLTVIGEPSECQLNIL
jgi:hypothetical protein